MADAPAILVLGEGVDDHQGTFGATRDAYDRIIRESVARTGRLVVADTGWARYGFAAEVAAVAPENVPEALRAPGHPAGLPGAGVVAAGGSVAPVRGATGPSVGE